MWQRFTWYDVRVIGHYLGVLISFFSIALAVPLVVAVVCQEWEPACRYLLAIGELLRDYGDYRGTFVVTAAGNEANTARHYESGVILQGGSEEVE